jgi:Fe2+ or Zn2+ uptake regulation protein
LTVELLPDGKTYKALHSTLVDDQEPATPKSKEIIQQILQAHAELGAQEIVECWPSDVPKISVDAVKKALKELANAGLVTSHQPKSNGPRLYSLAEEPAAKSPTP